MVAPVNDELSAAKSVKSLNVYVELFTLTGQKAKAEMSYDPPKLKSTFPVLVFVAETQTFEPPPVDVVFVVKVVKSVTPLV